MLRRKSCPVGLVVSIGAVAAGVTGQHGAAASATLLALALLLAHCPGCRR